MTATARLSRPVERYFPPRYRERSLEALELTLTRAPAYAAWRTFDPGPDRDIDRRYAALPTLNKADLRRHTWRGFVPVGVDADAALARGEIELVSTSGTTGEQVTNAWCQRWWNASERASWRLHSLAAKLDLGEHREAILASPLNVGVASESGFLSMERRTRGRFLYLNEKKTPALWGEATLERMLDELARFRPVVLEANPSYLARLARYAARVGRTVYQPKLLTLTYENPTPLLREHIRRAFTAPLASSYGSTEAGYVFMECEAGRLHQVCEHCRVDFQPLRPEHGGPRVGRVLLTTLTNPWRCLTRFDVGDLASLSEDPVCPCGRNEGYLVDHIVGRTANLTFSTDGRAVFPLTVDTLVAEGPAIVEYQVTQSAAASYAVRIVVEPGRSPAAASDAVGDRLKSLYGPSADIAIDVVDSIEASPSGKYRTTACAFSVPDSELFPERA